MSILWRSPWRTNLLKCTLVHKSGVVLRVEDGNFLLGAPLPNRYNIDNLIEVYSEAKYIYQRALDASTHRHLRGLWFQLKRVQEENDLTEICFERLLNEDGTLRYCRIHGAPNVPTAEVLRLFSQCVMLGVLLPSRHEYVQTDVSTVGTLQEAMKDDPTVLAMSTMEERMQYIERFKASDRQLNFAVSFAGIGELTLRRAGEPETPKPPPRRARATPAGQMDRPLNLRLTAMFGPDASLH